MAGFEFGEELVCLKVVKIGRETYPAGAEFPYEEMDVEPSLIESLLNKRSLCRKSRVSPKMMKELKREKTSKRIRNYPDGRVVVSWPSDEPIPDDCIDGRSDAKQTEDKESGQEEIESDFVDSVPDGDIVAVVPAGRGWCNVTVNGSVVNENKLRKVDAEKLKEEYK